MFALVALIVGGVAAYAIVHGVRGLNAAGSGSTSTAAPVGKPPAPTTPATPRQGGKGMSRLERIAELSAKTPRTTDEQAELQRLAREEIAWREQRRATESKLPVYPVGMEATFGGKWIKILKAWQNGGTGPWSYQIDAKLGMFLGLGDGQHTLTETEIRSRLTDALGAMGAGQAYARGLNIVRNRVGGLVESATQDPKTGEWHYTLKGWGAAPIAQSELTAAMRAA
jgi:hypothetical protein